ncbi:Integrin-linked kinase-associated serine/threonine phosphatase [Trichostrongylus colubriformis]|uniref:Integrin-linked kinase-associated serine/threonine phosphatase n=1 Tax=Trichostrongylus colubriformis TaxID=6319 RepID=A0AAN8IJI2_TRICO
MPVTQGKRGPAGVSLYDDDDETSPSKKAKGLYSSGDELETSTTVTEMAPEKNSNGASKSEDVAQDHGKLPSADHHEIVTRLEPLQLISVLGCRRGQREDMQDAHLLIEDLSLNLSFVKRCAMFAIFDGHAGIRAAKYCEENLPALLKKKLSSYTDLNTLEKQLKRIFTETYKSVDEGFLAEARKTKPVWKDGTTVTCVLLLNDSLYVANLGDSKAIVCRSKEDGFSHIELTVNHNPTMYEERMRIQKAGGTVRDGRVDGIIEVSRSIGDGQFKTHGVTCIPDMKKLTITSRDRFLFLVE